MVVARRHILLGIPFSSDLPLLRSLVHGNERMSAARLDRLTHRATILEFVGTSYRFRQQLQHQEPLGEGSGEPVAAHIIIWEQWESLSSR